MVQGSRCSAIFNKESSTQLTPIFYMTSSNTTQKLIQYRKNQNFGFYQTKFQCDFRAEIIVHRILYEETLSIYTIRYIGIRLEDTKTAPYRSFINSTVEKLTKIH